MMAPWTKLLGDRSVQRTVQGVELTLPRSHMLPVYARIKPSYGQNLVKLATDLAARLPVDQQPLRVVDIGANVGDSALQINAATGAHVLCIEGDPYWAEYLHRNVDGNVAITVEEVLLLPEESELAASSPVRDHGTTRFIQDSGGPAALPSATASDLRARNQDFDRVRLIKSDTDGFDPALVPAAAQAWADCGPVLFFEFDPELARKVGYDPNDMWGVLADLGYSRLAIWDNAGEPLGQLDIGAAAETAATLEPKPVNLGYHFWDVAACRADDMEGRDVLERLVPLQFDVRGTRR
jgi:FkbM family methyltransferase